MTTGTTNALNALSEIVQLARTTANAAAFKGKLRAERKADHIARVCDAARTRLVQDGPAYLEPANAIVDTAYEHLAAIRLFVKRARPTAGQGYITLDCRDGKHTVCDECRCECHRR